MELLITVVIIIAIVDAIVHRKKPNYKNQYQRRRPNSVNQNKSISMHELIKSILGGIFINKELKKLDAILDTYKVEEEKPNYSETIHPANKDIIRWTKPFLRSIEWKRYEEVCMEYLKIKNCKANVTCIGADDGIDIKISDSYGTVFAVAQCKAWNKPIGVSLIRELYGVMAADKIKHGIFLTTSEYSKDAIEFAKGKNLMLIDSDEFIAMINNLDDESKKRIDKIAIAGDYTTPTCVRCNVKMVKRTAKTGKSIGNQFWGCPNYPICRNTMYIK
ncbi:MAG: restriction endonuclease [Methylovulum sp.]|nr:MAG: restriction endonuclease [Methylovulum sp.]